MHNYQRSLKEPTAAVLSAADSTARQYSSNLERALAAASLTQQPLPCRRRLELLVLAKVKAQLHQIGERSDNDVKANAQASHTQPSAAAQRGNYYTSAAAPKSEAEPFGSARGAYLLASPRYGALQKVTPISLEPASRSSHPAIYPLEA